MNKGFKDLTVYQLAYKLAMDIFNISKSFPVEEKYSLTDQIRRSSRSVCANLSEAYRKRRYPKHFTSKIRKNAWEYGKQSGKISTKINGLLLLQLSS